MQSSPVPDVESHKRKEHLSRSPQDVDQVTNQWAVPVAGELCWEDAHGHKCPKGSKPIENSKIELYLR